MTTRSKNWCRSSGRSEKQEAPDRQVQGFEIWVWMIQQDHLGFVSGPGQTAEFVSFSETQNTTLQLQLWATQMPILHIDPDYKPTGPNPQSDRTTQHGGNVRPDRASRGFMRGLPGLFKAADNSGRLIIRAVNDNQAAEYSFGRSLLKRMVRMLRAWGRT